MGGHSSNKGQKRINNEINQQIQQSQTDLENKRQELFEQRLSIIKSQSAPQWTPPES